MEQEIHAGYMITDRLTVGNTEFVIGQRKEVPVQFVTWKCRKGEKGYFWGHYLDDRLTALEDLCNRSLAEIHELKSLRQEQASRETAARQLPTKKHEPER
ncbi:MAG: hypothetical protein K6T85_07370 [Gorillibacterium sp.]|nr:hypothetical protein [Gorillibacterium sp.]